METGDKNWVQSRDPGRGGDTEEWNGIISVVLMVGRELFGHLCDWFAC
jgi:hypothetical protein